MNNLIGGIWWFLIGMFLRYAASMSYKNVIVREMLPAFRAMQSRIDNVNRVMREVGPISAAAPASARASLDRVPPRVRPATPALPVRCRR